MNTKPNTYVLWQLIKEQQSSAIVIMVQLKHTGRIPVVSFHGSDPGHQAKGGLGGFLDHLRLKVGVVHVGPDLGNDFSRDVVLVVCLKLL